MSGSARRIYVEAAGNSSHRRASSSKYAVGEPLNASPAAASDGSSRAASPLSPTAVSIGSLANVTVAPVSSASASSSTAVRFHLSQQPTSSRSVSRSQSRSAWADAPANHNGQPHPDATSGRRSARGKSMEMSPRRAAELSSGQQQSARLMPSSSQPSSPIFTANKLALPLLPLSSISLESVGARSSDDAEVISPMSSSSPVDTARTFRVDPNQPVAQKVNLIRRNVKPVQLMATKEEYANMPMKPELNPHSTADASSPPSLTNAEAHEGRNIFFCHNRFVVGPGWHAIVWNFSLIALCAALFLSYPAARLLRMPSLSSEETAHIDGHKLGLAAIITGVVCFLAAEFFLLRTATSDPGIIPRLRYRFQADSTVPCIPAASTVAAVGSTPAAGKNVDTAAAAKEEENRIARVKGVNLTRPRLLTAVPHSVGAFNGVTSGPSFPVDLKYCDTCEMHRPPRATHCNVCQNCVERFDHHCPWIGTCVGLRNYRSFHGFLYSLFSLIILVFAVSVLHLHVVTEEILFTHAAGSDEISRAEAIRQAIAQEPCSLFLPLFSGLFGVFFVFPLVTLHIFLVFLGQTTNEYVKGTYRLTFQVQSGSSLTHVNPWDRGAWENWKQHWWGERLPSQLHVDRPAAEPPLLPVFIPSGLPDSIVASLKARTPLHAHATVRHIDAYEMAERESAWERKLKLERRVFPGEQRVKSARRAIVETEEEDGAVEDQPMVASPDRRPTVDAHLNEEYPSHHLAMLSLPVSPSQMMLKESNEEQHRDGQHQHREAVSVDVSQRQGSINSVTLHGASRMTSSEWDTHRRTASTETMSAVGKSVGADPTSSTEELNEGLSPRRDGSNNATPDIDRQPLKPPSMAALGES